MIPVGRKEGDSSRGAKNWFSLGSPLRGRNEGRIAGFFHKDGGGVSSSSSSPSSVSPPSTSPLSSSSSFSPQARPLLGSSGSMSRPSAKLSKQSNLHSKKKILKDDKVEGGVAETTTTTTSTSVVLIAPTESNIIIGMESSESSSRDNDVENQKYPQSTKVSQIRPAALNPEALIRSGAAKQLDRKSVV